MCDFHVRLIAVAEKLGAQQVRFEPPGAGERDGRFRSHPHITGLLAGTRFHFPLPSRPKDTPRRWLNYVANLRRLLIKLGAPNPQSAGRNGHAVKHRRRKARPHRPNQSGLKAPSVSRGATRLDRDPWAALRAMRHRIEGDPLVAGIAAYIADPSKE